LTVRNCPRFDKFLEIPAVIRMRHRALILTMLFSFARISAVLSGFSHGVNQSGEAKKASN